MRARLFAIIDVWSVCACASDECEHACAFDLDGRAVRGLDAQWIYVLGGMAVKLNCSAERI